MRVFTDSKTLFDSVTTFYSMFENNLQIDIAVLRGICNWRSVENRVDKVTHNIADSLTK